MVYVKCVLFTAKRVEKVGIAGYARPVSLHKMVAVWLALLPCRCACNAHQSPTAPAVKSSIISIVISGDVAYVVEAWLNVDCVTSKITVCNATLGFIGRDSTSAKNVIF